MMQHLTHGGLPDGMTRWQFFGLIESARRQLGLSKGANAYGNLPNQRGYAARDFAR